MPAMTNARLTDRTAQSARFVAFAHSTVVDLAPIALRDVEDLHFEDFDLVVADQLADAYDAADVAIALARLLGEPAPAALVAHDLGAAAARLAG
jgi:predicted DCC family thiol-disulfide oxidoreductase YuxK